MIVILMYIFWLLDRIVERMLESKFKSIYFLLLKYLEVRIVLKCVCFSLKFEY